MMEGMKNLNSLEASSESTFNVNDWLKDCYGAMDDDFNTPILISYLFEAIRVINGAKAGSEKLSETDISMLKESLSSFVFDVLGLKSEEEAQGNSEKLEGAIQLLIKMRNQARADKNWALSDQIRDELLEVGIQLKDGKDGTDYSLN